MERNRNSVPFSRGIGSAFIRQKKTEGKGDDDSGEEWDFFLSFSIRLLIRPPPPTRPRTRPRPRIHVRLSRPREKRKRQKVSRRLDFPFSSFVKKILLSTSIDFSHKGDDTFIKENKLKQGRPRVKSSTYTPAYSLLTEIPALYIVSISFPSLSVKSQAFEEETEKSVSTLFRAVLSPPPLLSFQLAVPLPPLVRDVKLDNVPSSSSSSSEKAPFLALCSSLLLRGTWGELIALVGGGGRKTKVWIAHTPS